MTGETTVLIPIMPVDADAPTTPNKAGNRENIIAEQLAMVPATPTTALARSWFTKGVPTFLL